jgi:transcriptional regulator with GAF, ATPase, and Fis domain
MVVAGAPAAELAAGLPSRFQILQRAGRGGSAEVWKARDSADGSLVALKIARGVVEQRVLAAEARHAALAVSPLLPELVDLGVLDGACFLALRWAEGQPLDRHRGAGDVQLALRVARDVGEALGDLHAVGLAHGDLKPANLVCGPDGRVRVIDLGLACEAHDRELQGATPRYLASQDAELGDARARDLIALGAVLAELCAADVAQADSPIEAARRAELPEAVAHICAALLAPSPGARPSPAWVRDAAVAALGEADGIEQRSARGERDARRVRASYLRVRRHELAGATLAHADAAPWLADAVSRAHRAEAMYGAAPTTTEPSGARPKNGSSVAAPRSLPALGPLDATQMARWLTLVVGSAAASWPVDSLLGVPERLLAPALVELARRLPPAAWTCADVEAVARRAMGSDERDPPSLRNGGAPFQPASPIMDAQRAASLALGVARVPPDALALEAIEHAADCPAPLALAAAEALRLAGEVGRARSLVLRPAVGGAPGGHAAAAEVLRRAGDVELAAAHARAALDAGDDASGRARAALARVSLDAGRAAECLEICSGADPSAAVCEVSALAASAGGDSAGAVREAARGAALARTPEEHARLAAMRGFVAHALDPAASRAAFGAAVDHAVRAGAVVEEATYRTGEAAAAADLGDVGAAIQTARRAALLWEHLGRPSMAARALLAQAAAWAAAGMVHDALRVADEAVARAREGGDRRSEAYAWWVVADVSAPGAQSGVEAAARAAALLGAETHDEDALRGAARLLRHAPEQVSRARRGRLDAAATADEGGASTAARLDWWGARAEALNHLDPSAVTAADLAAEARTVLGPLCALVDVPAALATRGTALLAGCDLATRAGDGEIAQRLLVALSDAAREMMQRAPPEMRDAVRAVPWVARGSAAHETGMRPEQARELELLVRSLGERDRLRPLLERVVDALVLWTGVERGLLLLRAPDDRLMPRAARNLARADLTAEQVSLSQTLARRAVELGEPVVAVDAAGELSSMHQSVHALKLRSVLAVPLIARGEVLGVVYLDDRVRRGAFGPRELAWARTIASLAAVAIADARDQVLLRRAARRARRATAELAETLAHREAALDVAERELARARVGRGTRFDYDEIVGESEAVRAMLRIVDRVTGSDVPVLLVGESGSGKELVARAIHNNGPRSARPFVGENCGAIPEGLLESTLFGHARGAFTGADRPRAGLFEVADRGTLFLDEVGEMSLGMQAKLLRVLEDGLVRPLGTERTRKVDVRVVAATHRDLEAMVKAKTFREDLFYRLNIITVRVPPLRERASDVPLIVQALLRKHGNGAPVRVTRAALDRLMAFAWPGNVRQLENEIRRALVLSDGVIDRDQLSAELAGATAPAARETGLNVRLRVDGLETELVREALGRTRGNQTQAAKLLGLSRFGLQKMIKRLGI